MSTKKTDALIEWARRVADANDDDGYVNTALAAKAEMDAIKRAAKEWVETDGQPGPGRMQRLDTLMRSIAKDAP
jgi:hypothetical protein